MGMGIENFTWNDRNRTKKRNGNWQLWNFHCISATLTPSEHVKMSQKSNIHIQRRIQGRFFGFGRTPLRPGMVVENARTAWLYQSSKRYFQRLYHSCTKPDMATRTYRIVMRLYGCLVGSGNSVSILSIYFASATYLHTQTDSTAFLYNRNKL